MTKAQQNMPCLLNGMQSEKFQKNPCETLVFQGCAFIRAIRFLSKNVRNLSQKHYSPRDAFRKRFFLDLVSILALLETLLGPPGVSQAPFGVSWAPFGLILKQRCLRKNIQTRQKNQGFRVMRLFWAISNPSSALEAIVGPC